MATKKKNAASSKPNRNRRASPKEIKEDEVPFVPDFSLLKPTPTELELSLIGAALVALTPTPERQSPWGIASRFEGVTNRL